MPDALHNSLSVLKASIRDCVTDAADRDADKLLHDQLLQQLMLGASLRCDFWS